MTNQAKDQLKTNSMKTKEKTNSNIWSHHDTMIVNLRDWVTRELDILRNDIASHAPKLCDSTSKILKSAEDLNTQMFDLVRRVADMAEKEADSFIKRAEETTTKTKKS